MENENLNSPEDLEHPKYKKSSDYYAVGLNIELILAIVALSISFVWFVISAFNLGQFSIYNFLIFALGIIMLILGLHKRKKIKNNDLDF